MVYIVVSTLTKRKDKDRKWENSDEMDIKDQRVIGIVNNQKKLEDIILRQNYFMNNKYRTNAQVNNEIYCGRVQKRICVKK